jgi:hypothetical protein
MGKLLKKKEAAAAQQRSLSIPRFGEVRQTGKAEPVSCPLLPVTTCLLATLYTHTIKRSAFLGNDVF